MSAQCLWSDFVVMRSANWIIVCSLLAIPACSSVPSVKYVAQPKADDKGLIKFYLPSTDITISKVLPADTREAQKSVSLSDGSDITFGSDIDIGPTLERDAKVVLTPKEHRETMYAVVPDSSWVGTVRTNLKVSYFDTADTSHLIKIIGSEVQDDRTKIIAAIGAVAVAAATVAAFDSKAIVIRLPVVVDSYAAKDGEWKALPNNPLWFYRLDVSIDVGATLESKAYFEKFGKETTSTFPISACRRATLHLKRHPDNTQLDKTIQGDARFELMFADPDRVDTLAFPEKGSISLHAVCGADLITEKADIHTAWDLVEALMNQVKTVKDKVK